MLVREFVSCPAHIGCVAVRVDGEIIEHHDAPKPGMSSGPSEGVTRHHSCNIAWVALLLATIGVIKDAFL